MFTFALFNISLHCNCLLDAPLGALLRISSKSKPHISGYSPKMNSTSFLLLRNFNSTISFKWNVFTTDVNTVWHHISFVYIENLWEFKNGINLYFSHKKYEFFVYNKTQNQLNWHGEKWKIFMKKHQLKYGFCSKLAN